MKIEKISMEFVTFDAQDVIATSGGPQDLWFYGGTLGAKFTPGTVGDNGAGTHTVNNIEGIVEYDGLSKIDKQKYYHIGDGSTYNYTRNTHLFNLEITDTSSDPQSPLASSWQDIYDWIMANQN